MLGVVKETGCQSLSRPYLNEICVGDICARYFPSRNSHGTYVSRGRDRKGQRQRERAEGDPR